MSKGLKSPGGISTWILHSWVQLSSTVHFWPKLHLCLETSTLEGFPKKKHFFFFSSLLRRGPRRVGLGFLETYIRPLGYGASKCQRCLKYQPWSYSTDTAVVAPPSENKHLTRDTVFLATATAAQRSPSRTQRQSQEREMTFKDWEFIWATPPSPSEKDWMLKQAFDECWKVTTAVNRRTAVQTFFRSFHGRRFMVSIGLSLQCSTIIKEGNWSAVYFLPVFLWRRGGSTYFRYSSLRSKIIILPVGTA